MLDCLRDIENLNNDKRQLFMNNILQNFFQNWVENVRMVYWVEKKTKDGSFIKVQDSTRLDISLHNNLHYSAIYDILDFNPSPQYKNNDRILNIWTVFQALLLLKMKSKNI